VHQRRCLRFKSCGLFDPEDEDTMFFRNVRNYFTDRQQRNSTGDLNSKLTILYIQANYLQIVRQRVGTASTLPGSLHRLVQAMDVTPLFTKLIYIKYDFYLKLNSRTRFPFELNSQ
jgi:hypothetical protein